MALAPVPEQPRSATPARLPAAKRRRQLVDVAIETFARRGFDATSMDDIADAAGVTKPVLYQHFRSKKELYLTLLDDVGGQLLEAIAEATAAAEGPRRQVEAGFAAYFRFVAKHESAFLLLFGGGTQRHAELAKEVRRVEDTIAEAIAALIEADIDTAHRHQLAFAVVGMAEGVARKWVRDPASRSADRPERWDVEPERLARRVADLAWAGLRVVHRT
jgi:AcrR family transcriptional regulator